MTWVAAAVKGFADYNRYLLYKGTIRGGMGYVCVSLILHGLSEEGRA